MARLPCLPVAAGTGADGRLVDEATAAKVDDYGHSDLSDRHEPALRLADACLTGPGRIDDELQTAGRRHFSDAE